MLTVGGMDAAAVCDAGSICGDDMQCEIVFSPVACPFPMV